MCVWGGGGGAVRFASLKVITLVGNWLCTLHIQYSNTGSCLPSCCGSARYEEFNVGPGWNVARVSHRIQVFADRQSSTYVFSEE